MNGWFDRVVEVQLNQAGTSLWDADMGKVNLQSPEAQEGAPVLASTSSRRTSPSTR